MQALDPTNADTASINFTIPAGATELTAYAWCNKHGLWIGPTAYLTMQQVPTRTTNDSKHKVIIIITLISVTILLALFALFVRSFWKPSKAQQKQTDSIDI